jgi:hypothetical protein
MAEAAQTCGLGLSQQGHKAKPVPVAFQKQIDQVQRNSTTSPAPDVQSQRLKVLRVLPRRPGFEHPSRRCMYRRRRVSLKPCRGGLGVRNRSRPDRGEGRTAGNHQKHRGEAEKPNVPTMVLVLAIGPSGPDQSRDADRAKELASRTSIA